MNISLRELNDEVIVIECFAGSDLRSGISYEPSDIAVKADLNLAAIDVNVLCNRSTVASNDRQP